MFKTIVASVILFLFVLQANHLLFADEHPKATAAEHPKANADEHPKANAEVSAATAEVSAEENTAAVAETETITEAIATIVVETEESIEIVVEQEAEAEESEAAVTEAIATIVAETEESIEIVVEKEAEAGKSEAAVTEAISATEETTSVVVEEVVTSDEGSEAVVVAENDVVATVNGEEIFYIDFDRRLNVFRRMNQDVTTEIKMQVVRQLTKKVLLKQFVEKQDIIANAEDVQAELEKIKFFLQNNPSNKGKPLNEILETQGSSISELQNEVGRALALSKYLKSIVTEAEKRSYFDANKDAFNGSRVKASHVLIDVRDMTTDTEKEDAKKMIDVVRVELDKGADFAEMAKKYSNCPSADAGGDIGFFQRKGSIVEEFAVVAFAMEIGEVSDPVKTQFGYHIIKVTDKEEGKDVSYEDVSDMVDFVFMQIKTEELLKELNDKAVIKIML